MINLGLFSAAQGLRTEKARRRSARSDSKANGTLAACPTIWPRADALSTIGTLAQVDVGQDRLNPSSALMALSFACHGISTRGVMPAASLVPSER